MKLVKYFLQKKSVTVLLLILVLEGYVIQTSINWWIYVIILIVVIVIICISIGWRIWQAAWQNPAEVIKSE